MKKYEKVILSQPIHSLDFSPEFKGIIEILEQKLPGFTMHLIH